MVCVPSNVLHKKMFHAEENSIIIVTLTFEVHLHRVKILIPWWNSVGKKLPKKPFKVLIGEWHNDMVRCFTRFSNWEFCLCGSTDQLGFFKANVLWMRNATKYATQCWKVEESTWTTECMRQVDKKRGFACDASSNTHIGLSSLLL